MLIKDIEKMEAYTPTEYVNDSEPDLDADNLNKTERQLRDTVAKANEIIDTLKSLISNVSVNSEDTVPSSAVAYKMKQDIEQLNSNISQIGQILAAGSPTAYGTELGKIYDICSLSLPEGKWLVIGATLASGDLTIFNSAPTYSRKRTGGDDTNLVISIADGPKDITLRLNCLYVVGTIHNDMNYCYLKAIRIG